MDLVSITTPSLVDIMVFNLLIEALKEFSCFSSRISRYALTATGKPTLPIRLTNSLISIKNHLLHRIYGFRDNISFMCESNIYNRDEN
ncbi:hypothetical protein CLO_1080 [Clostridium botulinum E1 str. 'BoNT E Beluga']|nr:hypothetical protein CLO_1080 [Clostridium botulinum E1 str. 'BoNT E Beluga']